MRTKSRVNKKRVTMKSIRPQEFIQLLVVALCGISLKSVRCQSTATDHGTFDTSLVGRQLIDVPLTSSQNINTYQQQQQQQQASENSMPNFYVNSQAQKFRVNVSNVCEKNQMRVTIRLSRPFYGLIHAKDKRKKPTCFIEGTGEQSYTLDISYTLVQSEPNYCGVVSHHAPANQANSSLLTNQQQQILSLVLVVRLHKSIEFSDDRYFLLSCANRCSRPDCSTASATQLTNSTSNASRASSASSLSQTFRGLVASDSILSPVLRPNLDQTLSGIKLSDADWQASAAERCDLMLDLKFQWLIKLCWLLSMLLALMFCIVFYLCVALGSTRSSRGKNKDGQQQRTRSSSRKRNRSCNKSLKSANGQTGKQMLYTKPSSGSLLWSATTNTTTMGSSSTNESAEMMDKIREDNTFVAEQHQQMMLANMVKNTSDKYHNQLDNSDGQVSDSSHVASKQQLVLGRSLEPCVTGSGPPRRLNHNQNQLGVARVRRRRSIGGSAAIPANFELHYNGLPPTGQDRNGGINGGSTSSQLAMHQTTNSSKLDSSQRAKSRSQTTIHYDQGQDPFKTIPFSYLNNGYLSDSNTSQRFQADPSTVAFSDYTLPQASKSAYQIQDALNSQNLSAEEGFTQQSLPPDLNQTQSTHSILLNSSTNRQQQQHHPDAIAHQRTWSGYTNMPNLIQQTSQQMKISNGGSGNHPRDQEQQSSHHNGASQFDPRNTRQLIDLIQHKHRHQIAQANRTAAALQPNQIFISEQEVQRQPSLGNQQRNSLIQSEARVWR